MIKDNYDIFKEEIAKANTEGKIEMLIRYLGLKK